VNNFIIHCKVIIVRYKVPMMIMDEARYSLAVAAKVWDLPTPTARLYMNEYLALGPHDRKAAGQGATALLTARRVLQGAIGAELAPSFRTAALACKAALSFTDVSSPQEAPGYNREPGGLFEGASTALIAYPDGRGVVVRVDDKTPLQQIFFPIGGAGMALGRQPRGSFLLLDFTVKRVEQLLMMYESGAVI
jgi:hypothetical protein